MDKEKIRDLARELVEALTDKDIDSIKTAVVTADISVGFHSISSGILINKTFAKEIGIEDEISEMSDELEPILKKYCNLFQEKTSEYIKKDPDKAGAFIGKLLAEV